jgi:hypothetical protein
VILSLAVARSDEARTFPGYEVFEGEHTYALLQGALSLAGNIITHLSL